MARPRIGSHHAEWLSLVETSGPFLTVPTLKRVLPDGLDATPDALASLRLAHTEYVDDPGLQQRWVRFVVDEVLELADATSDATDSDPTHRAPENGVTLRPSLVVRDQTREGSPPVLLVHVHPRDVALDRPLAADGWAASPVDRAAELARVTDVPLALVTNGDRWTLVWARPGESTGTCTWRSDVWLEEAVTLRAFVTFLGARRFFVLPEEDGLARLLEESAGKQQEVADQLGTQVRHAVELLIGALDQADRDRHGELLVDLEGAEVYRGAVTTMMRLVFLFVAEERRLLPIDHPWYSESLAASTLRAQLQERADRYSENVLEASTASWHRVLALFRAVHGGIEHDDLRLPAYGGGLFDPDRYPFLEGRRAGTTWRETGADPLPVDDRTMLHILDALQTLEQGGARVLLSYEALDVEQIGHVYEGLLDHTALRLTDTVLALDGKLEPEIALSEIEGWATQGDDVLVERLAKETGRSAAAVRKALGAELDEESLSRLRAACDNGDALAARIRTYAGLLRADLRGDPLVVPAGSLFVTQALDRRSSGTYYTPRSLAEEVVGHALDPAVYSPGPAESSDPKEWCLKPADALLDLKVVDIAMGSGAFLVAACRYLAARVLEAWEHQGVGEWTVLGRTRQEAPGEPLVPRDPEERQQLALRLVAERCLYGVDKNGMAVELAKLSLWLLTLARDRPFSFVDHALRTGDSLIGVTTLEQLRAVHLEPGHPRQISLGADVAKAEAALMQALTVRTRLESFVVRDPHDAREKALMLRSADEASSDARLIGDIAIGAAFAQRDDLDAFAGTSAANHVAIALDPAARDSDRAAARDHLQTLAADWLLDRGSGAMIEHRPLHWPVEFPEVFERQGFDAVVGNPPFLGNKYWKGSVGAGMQPYLENVLGRSLGRPDIVAVFLARAVTLLSPKGVFGLLATQSVTEVDSRRLVGATVLKNATFVRGTSSAPWPGTSAQVRIAKVWGARGTWAGSRRLDDVDVDAIGADLRPRRDLPEPHRLRAHIEAFQGVDNSRGGGFVLAADDALCGHDVVRPYVSGTDLTEGNPFSPTRRVIDLTGLREDSLSRLPDLLRDYLFETVAPTRTPEALRSYQGLAERWWTFWNTREPQLERVRAIAEECVVVPAVAKYTVSLTLPSDWVYTNKVFVAPLLRDDLQAVLLSAAFDTWLDSFGGSLGGGKVMKVAAVTETFPLPRPSDALGNLGPEWQQALRRELDDGQPSLNAVLNAVHDEANDSSTASSFRERYRELDRAVCDAYGWSDLELEHGFHETKFGRRFSPAPPMRAELLNRLLRANQAQYEQELSLGLHNKTKRKQLKPASQGSFAVGTGG